jgi:hypothetical protein
MCLNGCFANELYFLQLPDFSSGLQRRIVSIIRSRVSETSPNVPRMLSFGFRREWSVFRQRSARVPVLTEEGVDISYYLRFIATSLNITILHRFAFCF